MHYQVFVLQGFAYQFINYISLYSKNMIAQIELKTPQIYAIKRAQIIPTYPSVLGLSDSAIYTYTKDATFLRPKQQHHSLFFFQGLNTNPQNLSIFLMEQSKYHQQTNPNTKQKITKGLFHVYDIYNKWDCVIQINIPGNLKIYKLIHSKKQIVTSQQIDLMYVSSVLRSFYQKNLLWGRYYELFTDPKDNIAEFNNFMRVFFRVIIKHEIFISEEFQATAEIKGSHSLTLLLRFIREKRIMGVCLLFLNKQIEKREQLRKCAKVCIFMGEVYSQQGKYSKSIQCTVRLGKQYDNDAYVLYYKAKYLYSLLMVEQALQVLRYIVQYNQFEVWMLLARLHIEHKDYGQALICLNNGSKLSKIKPSKSIEISWKVFQQIGKVKSVSFDDPIHYYIKVNLKSQNPLSIPLKLVDQKLRSILEHPGWKINPKQKEIYQILQKIFYKTELPKFQNLLKQIFQQQHQQTNQVVFRKGIIGSTFNNLPQGLASSNSQNNLESQRQTSTNRQTFSTSRKKSIAAFEGDEQLPNFLKETEGGDYAVKENRNLSIIPELESVIENSNYEEKEPEEIKVKSIKIKKRQMNEQFFKVLKVLFTDDDFQRAVHEGNYAKVLPIYNRLRNSHFTNNFYYIQMFKIFIETGNYSSIVVLLAEYLDFIESKGMKKIRRLPYWLQNWLFYIIDDKGMVFLNNTLNKLNYIDEPVIEAKENAKKWRITGVTY